MTHDELRRFAAGDPDVAETVVRRAGRIALPLAAAVLGDREEAADVTQDVAVEVLRGLRRLRDPERFDAWVRRIAVRRTLRAARGRRLRRSAELPLEAIAETAAAPGDGAADVVLRAALRSALGDLSPRQRLAVALRYVHGLSDAEIAAALGCRPGTASSLLTRSRELLRRNGQLAPMEGGL